MGQHAGEASGDAVDALPDGVVVFDRDGSVVLVNRAAEQLFGIDRDAVVGQQFAEAISLTNNDGRSWVDYNCPFDGPRTRTGVPEQSWVLPNGTEALVTARIRRDTPLGPATGVAVSVRSGRGRARLDRERSDLVAAVAHELRSPLTGVKGFVQAMLSRWGKLNDEQKLLMLTTVHADADRLSRLITELLDVARLDTGRLSLARRGSDVRVLLDRIVSNVQAGAQHDIVLDAPHELPEVYIDPDKFTQVVTNVVENAIRHGGGTVRVRAEPWFNEGWTADGVRLTVDDEGEGIPIDMRRRVFTKFWTGHGNRGGTGLGLYLVNGIARAHGGQVAILDAPGGGARIVMDWPGQPDF
ncbi:PAS domain-containing sensor histidine kinase [Nocardioides agariphilus]|uniref:histidine kinase n=1 Tax=Nocardioides agariphilus TaxID=433664 RepID=A0A930YP41_9ACTN|nr:PAS domain-containing sensor histidine kinase [Nocardioides agariphilus]